MRRCAVSTIDPYHETSEARTLSDSQLAPRVRKRLGQAASPPAAAELQPRGRKAPRRGRDLHALLLGSPRAVLARLTKGDPLELRALVAKRLRRRHLLMDAERIHLAALVHCAREGAAYRGSMAFERWLEACVNRAIDALLDSPALQEQGRPVAELWREFAQPLGLSPERMARASVNFNALPLAVRRAFFQLVLGGRSLDEWAMSCGRPATELARDARRALQVFLDAAGPEAPPSQRTSS